MDPCLGVLAVIRVKVQQCAESLASSVENKQTFQAGTQEVGGQIRKQQQDQARTNELKAHYLPFTPTHTCSLTFPTPTTQI